MCGGFILNSAAEMELITHTTLFQSSNTVSLQNLPDIFKGNIRERMKLLQEDRKTALGRTQQWIYLCSSSFPISIWETSLALPNSFQEGPKVIPSFLSPSLSVSSGSWSGNNILSSHSCYDRPYSLLLVRRLENVARLLHTSKEEN